MKELNIEKTADLGPKVYVYGNPDVWQLICKASSDKDGWMKSTKAMEVPGLGVVLQVTTEIRGRPSEALTFIPGAKVETDEKGNKNLIADSQDLSSTLTE